MSFTFTFSGTRVFSMFLQIVCVAVHRVEQKSLGSRVRFHRYSTKHVKALRLAMGTIVIPHLQKDCLYVRMAWNVSAEDEKVAGRDIIVTLFLVVIVIFFYRKTKTDSSACTSTAVFKGSSLLFLYILSARNSSASFFFSGQTTTTKRKMNEYSTTICRRSLCPLPSSALTTCCSWESMKTKLLGRPFSFSVCFCFYFFLCFPSPTDSSWQIG